MKFHEVLVLVRNLWVLVFITMCIFKWATQETKKSQQVEEIKAVIPIVDERTPPIIEEVIEEIELPKPIKKIKPIVSFDHIKKSLELEIIDAR